MKSFFLATAFTFIFIAPAFAQQGDADSSEFNRRVHDEVIRTLRSLGIHTSADSLESDSAATQPHKRTHRDTTQSQRMMSLMDRVVDPTPFSQWLPFQGFRYNRVDGLFLGVGSSTPHSNIFFDHVDSTNGPDDPIYVNDALRPTINLGYSFGSHYWQTELGLSWLHRFTDGKSSLPVASEFGFEWHDRTDSREAWIDDVNENTLFALISHEDPLDYYFKRKGFSGTARAYIGDEQLSVQYLDDNESSLHKREYWSLFGGKKLFHENWPIPQGEYKSIVLTSYFNNVNTNRLYRGWSILAEAELASGDHPYNQYTLDIRRYQPLARWTAINVRVRGGAVQGVEAKVGEQIPYIDSSGNVGTKQVAGFFTPWQNYYHLGGIGSMPAFDYRELSGNRMLLINAEWNFSAHDVHSVSEPANDFTVMLLFDAGYAYFVDDTIAANNGWNQMSLRNIKSDIGFAVGSENGMFRLGWMWRTDRAAGGTFFVRLARPF